VGKRLYPLRLGFTYLGHCFVLHWFAPDGRFLGLERVPVVAAPPPKHLGSTIFRYHAAFEQAKAAELAALKERLEFRPSDIAVQLFDSEEACLQELAGEYEEYLESPESFDDEERQALAEGLEQWRSKGFFVLVWPEEYWLSSDGRVIAT
jgi:hypothetical protein